VSPHAERMRRLSLPLRRLHGLCKDSTASRQAWKVRPSRNSNRLRLLCRVLTPATY
jgi:hypothetical protein